MLNMLSCERLNEQFQHFIGEQNRRKMVTGICGVRRICFQGGVLQLDTGCDAAPALKRDAGEAVSTSQTWGRVKGHHSGSLGVSSYTYDRPL